MPTKQTDTFLKVLKCIGGQGLTVPEIEEKYEMLCRAPRESVPDNVFAKGWQRNLLTYEAKVNVRQVLGLMLDASRGYVRREITRFTNVALEEDTPIYFVTQKGRDFISSSTTR